MAEALGQNFDAWLLIPFFLEGGRYTIEDVHYVAHGDRLLPAGQTEFARDAAFGFRASNLRAWVEEKTQGRISASAVHSISLEDIRRGGPERVIERLMALPAGAICVVNAASLRDLEVFTGGLLAAEAQGRRFLCRTAASFVQVRVGLSPRSLLTRTEILSGPQSSGGLIVVGSYVPRTTQQLESLFQQTDNRRVELNVISLLNNNRWQAEIEEAARAVENALGDGHDVVVYTSREVIAGQSGEDSLAIGQRISRSLANLVRAIHVKPRYLLAKGRIASSDVATRGLGVKRAIVMGQILPGVPVWQLGPESRFPGLSNIIFPGNVGGPLALAEVVAALSKHAHLNTPSA